MRVPRWQVAPSSSSNTVPKTASTSYMPSLGQLPYMQPLPSDYTTAQQPRHPPAPKLQQLDLFSPAIYGDHHPFGSYGFADADQWAAFPPMSTPNRSPSKKSKSQKKADGKQATFLTKLYA